MKKSETKQIIEQIYRGAAFKTRSLCYQIIPQLRTLIRSVEEVSNAGDEEIVDIVMENLLMHAYVLTNVSDKIAQIQDWVHICNSNQIVYRRVDKLEDSSQS